MYWCREEVEEYIRRPAEGSAEELGSPVEAIAQNTIDKNNNGDVVDKYENKGYDYVPIRPYDSQKYYKVEAGKIDDVDDGQYIEYNEVMLHCVNALTEYPFVLVTHPDRDSWKIVTAADLNAGAAEEYLFRYYLEAAKAVSELIKDKYGINEIQQAYEDARPGGGAVERWRKAVDEDVDLHPVEFMAIADMKEIVRDSDSLLSKLDFSSKTQCKKAFDTVEKYRNRIAHGNRSVISNEKEVTDLTESLEIACEIAANADNGNSILNL